MWLRKGTDGGSFKGGNETSGSIKCGEFFDELRTGHLLKKDNDWCVALTTPSIYCLT
jgi:hypothetical protein